MPLQAAGENLAYNPGFGDVAKSTFEAWLKSPGHRKNIEGEFDLTGIGVVKTENESYYFTQIFVQQR
ncbi:MAG: CAP domain-containing protein [Calditrichia bacterium]